MAAYKGRLVDLSADDRAVIESWLKDFNERWDEGELAVRVKKMPPDSSLRFAALAEMVKIDLERQWRLGRQISLESYLADYPELGTPSNVSADLILTEYEIRRQFGATAELSGYQLRFPNQIAELSDRIAARDGALSRRSSGTKPPLLSNANPPPRQPPEQFGKYRIVSRIGAGGMGSVYLAEDTFLGRRVALKFPDLGEDVGQARQRFLEEARSAATLNHPYICHIYDADEIEGRPYLSMEYIEGQSLAQINPAQGMPQRQAAALVNKLATAMQAAHAKGVIHRDLKPANVMIKSVGDKREPVIVDFGLARRHDANDARITQTGQVMGTLAYMSPEQIRGDQIEVGPPSDIYALGVMLYELLTGRLPFNGAGLAVAGQILTQNPLPLTVHRADIDPRIEAICLKAMEKNKTDRYASMIALAEALTGFLRAQPRAATPGFDSLMIDLGKAPAESNHETPAAAPKPQKAGRARFWSFVAAAAALLLIVVGVVVLSNGGNHLLATSPPIDIVKVPDTAIKKKSAPVEKEFLSPVTGMKLIRIEPGRFLIGSPEGEEADDEHAGTNRERRITNAFYLGETEVTQAQYKTVMGQSPSQFKNQPDNPMEQVSWLDAVAFCNALSLKENLPPYYEIKGTDVQVRDGAGYRLPTEAEWEYACRAGRATKFSFGDNEADLGNNGWFGGNSGNTSHPVRQKRPNGFGLYDMHGNVWEWCWDWYDTDYYRTSPVNDPQGPSPAVSRVIRGGSWGSAAGHCRSAGRRRRGPDDRSENLGFRVALVR